MTAPEDVVDLRAARTELLHRDAEPSPLARPRNVSKVVGFHREPPVVARHGREGRPRALSERTYATSACRSSPLICGLLGMAGLPRSDPPIVMICASCSSV